MSAEQFITEHLDLWTEAVTAKSAAGRGSNGKIDLDGIKKLRELILELAVRGKLLPQQAEDESAHALLDKVAERKTRWLKDAPGRKSRDISRVADEDKRFDLPTNWAWARLTDLLRVINGRAYKKHEMLNEGTPLLRVGNLFTSNAWYYSNLELDQDKYIDDGDLIYAWSASFGPFIWDGGRAIYHYHIWKLDLFDASNIEKNYLFLYLQAITEEIKSSGSGIAMIHMTKAKMEELPIPIPPLAEQHRIVQKVDELMALCDRLEQQTHDQHAAHETLVDALLDTLTQSADAVELADNSARLAAHFDTLFTTEHSIDRLKQTVLQLGVMGRLANQSACDAPASALLKDIACNNAKIVKDKNAKFFQTLGSILESEKPFDLPDGWQWCRLGQLGYVLGGATPSKNNITYWNGDVPWVTPKDMKVELISSSSGFVTNKAVADTNLKEIPTGSLLIVVRGMILAHSFPTAINDTRVTINQDIKALVFSHIDKRFMLLLTHGLKSHFTSLVDRSSHGTCKITSTKLWNTLVPVPPENEQHRIIQKVDELLAVCDQLKDRLTQASKIRRQMADTVTEQTAH